MLNRLAHHSGPVVGGCFNHGRGLDWGSRRSKQRSPVLGATLCGLQLCGFRFSCCSRGRSACTNRRCDIHDLSRAGRDFGLLQSPPRVPHPAMMEPQRRCSTTILEPISRHQASAGQQARWSTRKLRIHAFYDASACSKMVLVRACSILIQIAVAIKAWLVMKGVFPHRGDIGSALHCRGYRRAIAEGELPKCP